MTESIKLCEKCKRWDGNDCIDGYETTPAYFQFCFLTEGNVPVKTCPGPYLIEKQDNTEN